MFKELLEVQKVLCYMLTVIFRECVPLNIDPMYHIPTNLTNMMKKLSLWDFLGRASTALSSIGQAIEFSESNSSPLSNSFA